MAPEHPEIHLIVDNDPARGTKADYFHRQGWGYTDSGFVYDAKRDAVLVKGNRYMHGGESLPTLKTWVEENMGVDWKKEDVPQQMPPVNPPIINQTFVEGLPQERYSRRSFQPWERITHSHGACLQEIFALRHGRQERSVDMVVYPDCTEDVEFIVNLANKHNVVIVPYGGGTNVTMSLMLPTEEQRMCVSVDMSRMNAIKWVDRENNMACVQAGIRGQDLERDLAQYGVCSGHEPDSGEFSTLGGWVATRASGMKKNTYGNIEDIVQNVTVVTSKGTYSKTQLWPRISNGPDLNHMMMGSEGNFGIVTEVVLKVRPVPEARIYDSILFPNFDIGIEFMHAVSKTSAWPSSLRLVDNEQFVFGMTMKPAQNSLFQAFVDKAKKFYVVNIKGFQPDKMVAATLLFEGNKAECEAKHKIVTDIAMKFQGMIGGPENGKRGYLLTFLIAYIRDFAFNRHIAAESFETSAPWSQVSTLCKRVRQRIIDEAVGLGFSK